MRIHYIRPSIKVLQNKIVNACFDWIRERPNALDIDNHWKVQITRLSAIQEGAEGDGIVTLSSYDGEVLVTLCYDKFDL